ncbi:MAG: ATP-binding protein [Geobacteraceae bacterium]|nr:ATP-binding protein [Geobacteraceae bacterium]
MKSETSTDIVSPEAAETAALRLEKEGLAQQVKRLIKAEGKLYAYQEELDAQLKEYKDLYALNRRFNATFDIRKVFEYSIAYIINNLEYERVIFFEQREQSDCYAVCTFDGYYDQHEKGAVAELVITQDDPLLSALQEGAECIVCSAETDSKVLGESRSRLHMNEYLIYPLCSHKPPHTLLAVGNSAANAEFYHRIGSSDGALLGIGNLVGLLVSAVENHTFYANMKRAIEQERCAEAKYRSIFENALEGIYQSTPAGRFINCNPATAFILGYDSPQQLIESVTDIESQLYVEPQRRRELFGLMRNGVDVKSFEVEFYRKDGSKMWALLSTRPTFDDNREILHVDGIIQDIGERKRAEKAVQDLNEELEQRVIARTKEFVSANLELRQVTGQLERAYGELKATQSRMLQQEKMASIGQLAAGVAHEINNPMGFIISNLNSLKKYTDKIISFTDFQSAAINTLLATAGTHQVADDVMEHKKALKLDYVLKDLDSLIQESLEGAERVKKIVQELKSFSRIDASDCKLADINEGLESTIKIVWNELKYNATVNKEYGDIPQTVCNLGQLNQVFMNILVNAAQSLENQGEISIRTSSDHDNIYVMISDTGSGIPADKLNRIFEPFYTSKEVGKGTGLGLSIAYDIVKKHNGEIQVESEVGKGTTFTLLLPIITG